MRCVRRWASRAVALAILGAVIWRLGTGPFLSGLKAIDARAVLAVAAIVLGTTLCSAWRWRIIAGGLGVRLSLPAAVAAYYRALFLNLTLPGGVAGDVHRGVVHGRQVHDVGRALRAVVWERAAGQVVQIVLTISALFVFPSPFRSSMPLVAAVVVAVALGAVFVAGMQIGGRRSRWVRVRNVVVTDIRDGVLRRNAFPAVAVASVLVVVGHAVTFLIAARTVGVTAPVARLLPLALLALMGMVLPNLAGWGPREGVTAWAFAAAGLGAHRGAATAVAYGVMVFAASLPGAILLGAGWLSRRRESKPRPRGRVVFRPGRVTDG